MLAEAGRVHLGETTWVWVVRLTAEAERLSTLSRVTVAVRALDG